MRAFRLVRRHFPDHWLRFAIAIVAMIIVAGMTALSAWIMRDVINTLLSYNDMSRVYLVAVGVAAIFTIKGVAAFVQAQQLTKAGNRIVAVQQREFYDSMVEHSVDLFEELNSSELTTRITHAASSVRETLNLFLLTYVRDSLTVVGLVIVMLFQRPGVSLVAFIFGPIVIYGVSRLVKQVREIAKQELTSISEIIRIVTETSIGIRVIKSFGLEGVMRARMQTAISDVEQRANRIGILSAMTGPLMETVGGFAIAGVIIVAGLSMGAPGNTPGSLMSFITALLLAYEPAKRVARARVTLELGLQRLRVFEEMQQRPVLIADKAGAEPLPLASLPIEFHDVSFRYKRSKTVLKDFSACFEADQMTALVGPSGGGKSTVFSLMMRFYDPKEGKVTIGERDISEVTVKSVREHFAYVGQDAFLFAGTIRENIAIANPQATDEEIVAATRMANLEEVIKSLPNGFDTDVGENGSKLSGGQRQRVSIARAVLKPSATILLDEATSALDNHAEKAIREALEAIRGRRTVIVIAHRLSTIRKADKILVLDAGRKVQEGSHDSLIAEDGLYKSLYDSQFAGAPAA
ncbi:MAG: ABC transporter ATP-binding protein [Rhodobiaceae bacterium]|nr:ABC transporter ATP-binding protein [Rhodobiaceae bacterium]MCC0056944.1 ABC transporter ATP-binding protein [Rhodobiaceae bacterium]